jgi:hypothetical protein
MNTITDDEIDAVAHAAWGSRYHPQGQRAFARAVLALAEQKNAAKVAELAAAERQRNVFAQQANEYAEEVRALRARIAELEARIDALMLEHCPDEMTPEQVAEWAKHQVPAEEAAQPAKVAAPTQADGWVMLDKRGLVHQERWWKWDFFGGIETREGFTPADVDNACREWPGLAPFTVVPVFLAAAQKREGGAA